MITANDYYVAFANEDGIYSRDLDQRDTLQRLAGRDTRRRNASPLLALSTYEAHLLAVANGNQTLVYNLETCALQHIIPGVGRIVTSLAWSIHDAQTIATGVLDGSICIWCLKSLDRPVSRLMIDSRIVCHGLAFCPTNSGVLASLHGRNIAVWSLHTDTKLLKIFRAGTTRSHSVRWNNDHHGKLLCLRSDRNIAIWDLASMLNERPQLDSEASHDNGDLYSIGPDEPNAVDSLELHFDQALEAVDWLGGKGIIGLTRHGREISVFSVESTDGILHDLWRCGLAKDAHSLVIRHTTRSVAIVAVSNYHSDTYVVPTNLCDELGRQRPPARPLSISSLPSLSSVPRPESSLFSEDRAPAQSMSPLPVRWYKIEPRTFKRTSKQLQQYKIYNKDAFKRRKGHKKLPSSRLSQINIAKDSLQAPERTEKGPPSPMPFLSPNVPSQQDHPSPHDFLSLDDSAELKPHSASSLDNIHSTATHGSHDSDSDDENFGSGLRGSGTLMPGGVNVPLPKACGAVFAPNGQLVTFFPPKIRPPSNRMGDVEAEEQRGQGQKRVARLFPAFGNLVVEPQHRHDSDTEGSDIVELAVGLNNPGFVIHPSSFPSQHSWKAKMSPVKSGLAISASQHKVLVQVRDIEALLPYTQSCIEGSKVLCNPGESGSDLCRHNAMVADLAGLAEVSSIWRLVAFILDDEVPLELHKAYEEDPNGIVAIARSIVSLSAVERVPDPNLRGRLRWSDNPLGGAWFMAQLLCWAEQRADLYLLAYLTAVVSQAEEQTIARSAIEDIMWAKLPTDGIDYVFTRADAPKAMRSPRLPLLRTNSQSISIGDSPPKPIRSSRTSSRNASQPTTPYVESNSSTPPFQFPTFSRQGAKLSFSGSASPEFSRGSFGAAAKFYAQSITDKFSTYGSSPPFKKLGTSPNSNELSSSLPNASGSWSKSVSFASTTGARRENSQLSRSFTTQNDEYDSDKTIEEGSIPHTPRSRHGDVYVDLKAQEHFTDERSGVSRAPFLTPTLAAKAVLWQRAFAEQLRVKGMLIEAVELEKVMGLTMNIPPYHAGNDGLVVSSSIRSREPTCSICFALIEGLQQLCPACLHTTHLDCLEHYLESLVDAEYHCTSGCGCRCADLAFGAIEWEPVKAATRSDSMSTAMFKRKASFTDPRRWRAQVEGDSW